MPKVKLPSRSWFSAKLEYGVSKFYGDREIRQLFLSNVHKVGWQSAKVLVCEGLCEGVGVQ